jgi:putative ABC transport system ATP-binding protein
MIDMKDIVKHYKMGTQTVKALDGVSLKVREGEFVAIIGPSGSGKSTLMNIIGCLDAADGGEYRLAGIDITAANEKALTRIRNENIGFIFQGFNLLGKLNTYENVELPLIYQGVKPSERRRRITAALERVGLSERMTHKPNELSGGQQQRVAIARALACRPSIILADEPTGNLDSKTGREIMEMFKELHESGNTILLITHDSAIADQAERRIAIEDGRIKAPERRLSVLAGRQKEAAPEAATEPPAKKGAGI